VGPAEHRSGSGNFAATIAVQQPAIKGRGAKTPVMILYADRLVDGRGGPARENMAVVVAGNLIKEVVPEKHLAIPEGDACETHRFPGATLLPGLIDCHTHTNMPADGRRGEDVIPDGDDVRLLRSARNVRMALESGVTTMCDNGAWNHTAFSLKEGMRQGLVEGPRLLVCGRPVTTTGGHCWYMGGEADGIDGVRRATRQLIKEGADFIKVMATGGSTLTSDPYRPAYTVEELRAIADEAHRRNRVVATHCRCTRGMSNVLEAGLDIIIHGFFADEDSVRRFDPRVAERIAKQGVWVNPTLHIGRSRIWQLRAKKEREGLTEEEEGLLSRAQEGYEISLQECRQLIESGVKLVGGSDCGWGVYPFGQFAHEISSLAEAGLTPLQAILAGTSSCAEALGILRRVGTLEARKEADLLIVEGDPTRDITSLSKVVAVFKGGQKVATKAAPDRGWNLIASPGSLSG